MVLAVSAVLVMVTAVGMLEWRQRGAAMFSHGPGLDEFRLAHPQLEVVPLVAKPQGRSPDNLLWTLRDRASGAAALVRRDFVLGRQVRFVPCDAAVPLPAGATAASCFRTSAVDGAAGASWVSFRLDEEGEEAAARVSAFYAEMNTARRGGHLAVHRVSAGQWCAGLFGAGQ